MLFVSKRQSVVRAFKSNERGNVAMIAALAVIPILTVAGVAIDFQMTTTQKYRVQSALDSALLAASKAYQADKPEAEIRAEASAYFNAMVDDNGNKMLDCEDLVLSFPESSDEVEASVRCNHATTLTQIAGKDSLEFQVNSTSTYGDGSLEVAMILDTTGSMAGTKIVALRAAAVDFIDIVIQDQQTPFYSKASIIPYSVAVNAGPLAEDVRGDIVPGRNITNAVWQTGTQKSITGVTRANPAVVTSNGHGFINGDRVWISGVNGMTQLNNKVYTVSNAATNTFRLQGTNSSSYSNYSSGGIIRKCLNTNCEVTVTANSHGLSDNDYVVISGVNGMTQINTATNATWQVSNVSTNSFVLKNSVGPSYSAYTNSGTSYCTTSGCEYYRFLNKASNAQRVHRISTCVTERIGDEAMSDVAPSDDPVGLNYPSTSNACPAGNVFMPLTSDKPALRAKANSLVATGSTAGHLGVAWGWYSLAPDFGYLFPAASRPSEYNTRSIFKIAVLMTDGEYNSAYCNGVIAGDSTSGSGSTADQINCNATNGQSIDQALDFCDAMKEEGILVYTVGFEVVNDPRARQLVNECATSAQYAYMASGSEELRTTFQRIARSINEVRLTH